MEQTAQNFVGVLKDPHTMAEIAAKHGVSEEALKAEMELGLKEEKDHTTDPAVAGVIVLHHLWEKADWYTAGEYKNAGECAWPKSYKARHIQPGLVFYADMGEEDPITKQKKGLTLLLTKEAIDKMRPTFKGKPVTNWVHKKVRPEDYKQGNADGIITNAYYNPEDGWDWVEFLVWDQATKDNCDRGFQLSCAYVPAEIKYGRATHNNLPYDGEVMDATYTHMAIVNNPRYERSLIMCNSLGGKAMKFFTTLLNSLTGKKEPLELDSKTEIPVGADGKKISLEELVNAYKAEQAAKEKAALENSIKAITDDTVITVDGKEVAVKDLKAAHSAMTERKNAVEAEEKAKKEQEEKAEAEKKNSEEEAKKKAEEEEKRNAAEKAAKEKEEADKKAETEKQNALEAEKHFLSLKNAKEKGGEVKSLPGYESQAEKLARGHEMFGKAPTAEIKKGDK